MWSILTRFFEDKVEDMIKFVSSSSLDDDHSLTRMSSKHL